MIANGLKQVINPSKILISEKDNKLSGHAIAAIIEGIRPLMIGASPCKYCSLRNTTKVVLDL